MTTVEFITALFYEVDEQLRAIPKHPKAHLWPSEIGDPGAAQALKGGGDRAFSRWLTRDYRALFPRLPKRTRLFRHFTTPHDWPQAFLAARRCSASSTHTGSSCSIRCAKAAVPSRWAAKASRITTGLLAGNSVSCSINGG